MYKNQYLLGTSTARPLIAKILVQEAHKCGADAIAHGATGKGNDQVRFDLGIRAFDPYIEIIAPWRTWDIKSREEEIAYLEARGMQVPTKKDDAYSRDDNIWHMSHEGLDLENPANEPKYGPMLKLCVPPEKAPDQAEYVEVAFERGVPVRLNGEAMDGVRMIRELNRIGGRHGVGVVDLVENRVVGMKSRGVYETPGGSILYAAHEQLEHLCLDRQMFSFKHLVADKFAELTYGGLWFTPLREALEAFVDRTQERVTGTVRMKLFKGSIRPAGATSPYLPVQRQHRQLRHRGALQPRRLQGLHPALRPAHHRPVPHGPRRQQGDRHQHWDGPQIRGDSRLRIVSDTKQLMIRA